MMMMMMMNFICLNELYAGFSTYISANTVPSVPFKITLSLPLLKLSLRTTLP